MKIPRSPHFLFLFVLFTSFSAHATTITQVRSFDASAGIAVSGLAGTVVPFDRFDNSLGTLDSIDVELTGRIDLHGLIPSNFVPVGPTLVPTPYPFSVNITQSYSGLNFLTNPQINLTGTATGADQTLDVLYLYTYSFSFDSVSELLGFAPVTTTDTLFATAGGAAVPPGLAFGQLDDFTTNVPGVPLLFVLNTLATSAFPPVTGGIFAGSLSNAGSMVIRYHFTEAASTIPEPSSLLLLSAGLACAGFGRGKRWDRRARA